jgi:hypothetical protein
MLSGIKFLHEGINYPDNNEQQRIAKNDLLNEANKSFSKACALLIDSHEDTLFIIVLTPLPPLRLCT